MAKATVKGLASKLTAESKKSYLSAKDKPAELPKGGGECPAGIDPGIAKITECKFGVFENGDNKGEYFFMAMAAVVSPKFITSESGDKIPVEGLITRIGPEPICDTPKATTRKTQADHLEYVMNQMKLMGADLSNVEVDDLESIAEAIKNSGPYIKFRTWKGKKATEGPYKDVEPRVQHTWMGQIEYEESEDDGVEDNTEERKPEPTPAEKKAAASKATQPAKPAATKKAEPKKKDPEPDPEAEEDVPFGDDLDMLVDRVNKGDEEAEKILHDRAKKLGYTQKEIEDSASWEDLAEMIRSRSTETASEEATESDSEEGEEDLAALAEAASNGDQEAADRLGELAKAAGISEDDYNQMSWDEAVAAIQAAQGTEEEVEEEEFTPAVTEIYKVVLESGKPAVECEILAVFEEKRTVNIKNIDTGKSFKGISWDKLQNG